VSDTYLTVSWLSFGIYMSNSVYLLVWMCACVEPLYTCGMPGTGSM